MAPTVVVTEQPQRAIVLLNTTPQSATTSIGISPLRAQSLARLAWYRFPFIGFGRTRSERAGANTASRLAMHGAVGIGNVSFFGQF